MNRRTIDLLPLLYLELRNANSTVQYYRVKPIQKWDVILQILQFCQVHIQSSTRQLQTTVSLICDATWRSK